MTQEFVPYEQALALKELGFDEPCFAKYDVPGNLITSGCYSDSSIVHLIIEQNDICEAHTLAPLYQQAFRWFREKHSLVGCVSEIHIPKRNNVYMFDISKFDSYIPLEEDKDYTTYEEAELACLKKLIEIVKNK